MMGIRYQHVLAGWGDCLKDKPRIWMLLRALKKKGAVRRKWPVTANMMKWIKSQLDFSNPDMVVLWADLCMAWMFLMRAGEHLAHDGRGYDMEKVAVGSCLTFRKEGELVGRAAEADSVGHRFRGSKMDQYNAGEWRNQWRGGEVCVLEALSWLQNLFPERFGEGEEAEKPLFRLADGSPLWRSYVQGWLERAAAEEGYAPERFGSHSLRIGGATAMLHAGVSVDLIKRMGRWVSDAFHGYLWESSEDTRDLAKKMSEDRSTLMISQGLSSRA